jgi:hypothetical protein
MKRFFYFLAFTFSVLSLQAQLPEDALRMTWTTPSGTARNQAIGGAMGSLGGEITATFVNPAGLGLYKTGEFVFSPGFSFLNGKGSFRGTSAKADNENKFNFGTSGFVWGYGNRYSRWTSKAFSLAVNRTANFNSTVLYRGANDYSSFAEPLANEFANSNLTIDQALNSNNVSLLTKMALYTYLVDTATIAGNTQVIARSELAGIVNQENRITTTGGITEIALGFASNMDDKFYLGFGFGLPIVNYEKTSTWREEDANGTGNNEFAYSTYKETYTSKGIGINAKLGMIFKPVEQFRLGFAIHTPSLYGLKDNLSAEMTTDIDTATGTVKVFTVKSAELLNGQNPQFEYDLTSPWRFLVSGSYVIREVEDVTKQRGFITADVEYVGYGSSKFRAADNNTSANYDDVNKAIKAVYKGAFNFRAGGELKFNTIMARLGFAYYGNPYDDKELKANRMNISGGLGYRNKGFFIDVTYVHAMQKNVNFPYRVDPPRLNTFANLRENAGNILLTCGIKF